MANAEYLGAALEALPARLRAHIERHTGTLLATAQDLPNCSGAEPDWCRAIAGVIAASDFVAETLQRDPGLLAELLEDGALYRVEETGAITARVTAATIDCPDEAGLKQRLRSLRRREMLRIAFRDLAGWAELDEVMAAVSELADACCDRAMDWLYRKSGEELGTPHNAGGQPAAMVVLGLGKLGGGELNFSSDIDLIFAYTEEGETSGGRELSNHEFFTRLGRRLINVLDEATADGFVFRVDMRLRPNGESGPLALSFDAMEHYYQTHGREWERYALIKARVIAGDQTAGRQLMKRLRPFIYRRYLDYGAVEALREMKQLINRELQRKGLEDNIKLGPGGIREVEFVTQTFQLIRGGRETQLQTNSLFTALRSLVAVDMLTAREVELLERCYRFLRRVENRLQMFADRQTQTLPPPGPARDRLAWSMGYTDTAAFESELARIMGKVHQQFEQVFTAPQSERHGEVAEPLHDVWLGVLEGAAAESALEDAGYRDPAAALNLLTQLRAGKAYSTFSRAGRERMDRLVPLLLGAAGLAQDPDATLTRLVQLLEAIGRRSVYLALLVENPMALSQLVKLCSASAWIASWISQHPILLDELLNPAALYRPLDPEQLDSELRQWLARIPEDDLEAQMEALREFRHSHVLRVAAADITEVIGPEQVGRALCAVAGTVLQHALMIAWRGLVERHGLPAGSAEGPAMAVIGMGKLGSLELGYSSDLDMIFLLDDRSQQGDSDGARPLANEVFYTRLGQRFLHILGTHTPAGVLYEVDMRLRPSGQSGPLVTTVETFRRYQLEKAWTWEHQALVRARPVAGDPQVGQAFEAVRREVLCRERDADQLARDVIEMRDKMIAAHGESAADAVNLKHDRGGIVDIEFIVQYCVLRRAREHPDLLRHTDNIRLLQDLAAADLLEPDTAQALTRAYRNLLSVEHRLKLTGQPVTIGADEYVDERRTVADIWRKMFGE